MEKSEIQPYYGNRSDSRYQCIGSFRGDARLAVDWQIYRRRDHCNHHALLCVRISRHIRRDGVVKTPEEIKKLLANHKGCIYDGNVLMADALALIRKLEEREWELFNLLSSAWFAKACYFKQEDGKVYSRVSGEYITFDQAIDEFASELTNETQLEAQVPKWISVEERLPEYGDVVLVAANGNPKPNVTLHNATLIASYWAEEGWIADGFEGWDTLQVTHWMPLPEPLKEG
jgi:hypothetical protein